MKKENENLKKNNTEQQNSINELNGKLTSLNANNRVNLTSNKTYSFELSNGWKDLSSDIPLSDSIRNYRYLEFQFDAYWKAVGKYGTEKTQFVATEQLGTATTANTKPESYIELTMGQSDEVMGFFTSEKNLRIAGTVGTSTSSYSSIRIRRIYGIK